VGQQYGGSRLLSSALPPVASQQQKMSQYPYMYTTSIDISSESGNIYDVFYIIYFRMC
jgi:hypothetical protein